MKIAIATIFYQNKAELERLINSIPDKAIEWFIGIDGIFRYTKEKYPELPELSTDGSRNLIISGMTGRKTNTASWLEDKANATEYEKRNKYLEICKELERDVDVLMIIDSDEYFVYDNGVKPESAWNTFKNNMEQAIRKTGGRHNVFGIRTYDPVHKMESYCPRVWYKPHEMRYINGSHYHFANIKTEQETIETFRKNRINYQQHANSIIKGLTLSHDHNLRSQEYLERRKDYQRYLVKFEELVQSYKHDINEAHILAKEDPKKEFEPT